MAQNVSYANNDSLLESLVLHTLPDFGEHGDGIVNNNFLLAYLKDKKRFDVVEGGLEFWAGVIKAENSNFKWQAATADMSANLQDPNERLRWEIMTFTGSLVKSFALYRVICNCTTRITVKIQGWTRPWRHAPERLTRASLREGYTVSSAAIIYN